MKTTKTTKRPAQRTVLGFAAPARGVGRGPVREAEAEMAQAVASIASAAAAIVRTADAATAILARVEAWLERMEKKLP